MLNRASRCLYKSHLQIDQWARETKRCLDEPRGLAAWEDDVLGDASGYERYIARECVSLWRSTCAAVLACGTGIDKLQAASLMALGTTRPLGGALERSSDALCLAATLATKITVAVVGFFLIAPMVGAVRGLDPWLHGSSFAMS